MKNAHAQRRRRFVRRLKQRHHNPERRGYIDMLTLKECRTTKTCQRKILRLIAHGLRMWSGGPS